MRLITDLLSRLHLSLMDGHAGTWLATLSGLALAAIILVALFETPSNNSTTGCPAGFGVHSDKTPSHIEEASDDTPAPQRDFTMAQLRVFSGRSDAPAYTCIDGDVFDITTLVHSSDDPLVWLWQRLAGKDCSLALAAGEISQSNGTADADAEGGELADLSSLPPAQRAAINEWMGRIKFELECPIVGRVSVPPSGLRLPPSALRCPAADSPPPGRVHAPIYIALKGDVFDVSFGGREMYGEGGPYAIFAGTDASRALAKMSFREEDILSRDLADLAESELRVLDDWHRKFAETKKYPIVGKIIDDSI